MGNVSSVARYYFRHFCNLLRYPSSRQFCRDNRRPESDDRVGRCDIDVLESTPEILDCAFPFLGKRASGSFHFNSRNVKKNRLIARADESSRKMRIARVSL